MRTLQFNQNSEGYLFLSDTQTNQLFYPSDMDGNFLNTRPEFYISIEFVSDGLNVYPVNFISESGLGWIAAAVNALANIGTAIIGSRASKNANESAERQLQTQHQIQLIAAQNVERQQALQNQSQSSTLSAGEMVGIAMAGVAAVGSIIYLVTREEPTKKSKSKTPIEK